jgi:molecular chaperone HscA
MLLASRSALDADGDLLSAEERSEVDSLMAGLQRTAADSEDAAAIEAAIQALARGTEPFAARRMNEGIRKALAGKNVESL